MASRPLSPHLSIYRFAYTMALSILHRATGVALSAGLLLLVAWFVALAAGSDAYARFAAFADHGLVRVVIAAFIAASCYHLANGVRHLVWDIGFGLERAQARASGRVVVIAAVIAAVTLIWLFLFAGGAA